MTAEIWENFLPIRDAIGDDREEDILLRQSIGHAVRFVAGAFGFPIGGIWWVDGIPGTVSIFLFRVGETAKHNDLWVIVGDCPPLALPAKALLSAAQILTEYCDALEAWLENDKQDVWPPTGSAKTDEYVAIVRKRVEIYREHVIPWLREGE